MSRRAALALALVVGVLAAGGALLVAGGGTATADEVRFQQTTSPGPKPFTKRADVKPGTFGGTGKDTVCDREKLIRALSENPQRLRAWAEVVGIAPDVATVSAYIRELRPVTLTQDTQVTNHSYSGGEARPFQAILEKGTAVLVDKDGTPVARCRCGNPLKVPLKLAANVKCYECPASYRLPAPCKYYDYDDTDYESYSDSEFRRTYKASYYSGTCYRPVLQPPPVNKKQKQKQKRKDPKKTGRDVEDLSAAERVKLCETPGKLSPKQCAAAAAELREQCSEDENISGCEKVCDLTLNAPGDLCPPIPGPGEPGATGERGADDAPALDGGEDDGGAGAPDGGADTGTGEPPDAEPGTDGDEECVDDPADPTDDCEEPEPDSGF